MTVVDHVGKSQSKIHSCLQLSQSLESEIVEYKPSDPPEFARVQCQTVLSASGHVWGVRGPGSGSHALR